MSSKITFKRGLKANLPILSTGEPALATDTQQVYVGDNGTNILLNPFSSTDISNINTTITNIDNYFKANDNVFLVPIRWTNTSIQGIQNVLSISNGSSITFRGVFSYRNTTDIVASDSSPVDYLTNYNSLTINTAGTYRFKIYYALSTSATATTIATNLIVNGTTVNPFPATSSNSVTLPTPVVATQYLTLAKGDKVTMNVGLTPTSSVLLYNIAPSMIALSNQGQYVGTGLYFLTIEQMPYTVTGSAITV